MPSRANPSRRYFVKTAALIRAGLLGLLLLGGSTAVQAQYVPAQLPLTELPREHPYQRALRDYLASLQEKDFAIERRPFTVAATRSTPEESYRLWLLTLNLPRIEAAALPSAAFTLTAIETGKGLAMPASVLESQLLAWLAKWDSTGNPHAGSRAVKLRAFVLAAIDLVMLDYLYEHNPQGSDRSDFLGGNLIWLGYTYQVVRDVLPAEARGAFEAGLKKHVLRLNRWGPRGAMTDMDLFAAVGLWYCAQALDDPEVRRVAESYARRLFTEERFFHPAGYFVDVGCFDTSYNGISLYFATWAALASDWKFAQEAVARAYRLRGHLCLPDPGGPFFGPSHMSSRTSADPPHDQWNFPQRPYAAALVTDEALHLAPLPTEKALADAPTRIVNHLNQQLATPRAAKPGPWRETHWSGAFNFAYEHYRPGYYIRRQQLEKEGSPLLKPVYARSETFRREFDKAFLIARFDTYAAVIHTGPIREWPHGFGGGMLSAFWTPSTGSALLGRRRGMQGPVRDALDEWRTWAVHAVSGTTKDGAFFTSASLKQPEVKYTTTASTAEATVAGPVAIGKREAALQYSRRFLLRPEGVTVRTSLQPKEPLEFAELHESLPIFLHDRGQEKLARTRIQFQIGEAWQDAAQGPHANVKAVRVERFSGAVQITFDQPRSVQLAPKAWTDGFQTHVTCQTILVALLPTGGPAATKGAIAIEYTLSPVPRNAPGP